MPVSHHHHWSILKAWKAWQAACFNFGDSDLCNEDELRRRANHLGIPAVQLRWVPSHGPDPISLLERPHGSAFSIRTKSLTWGPSCSGNFSTVV